MPTVTWRERTYIIVDGEGEDRADGSHIYTTLCLYWGAGDDEREVLHDRAGLATARILAFLHDDRRRPKNAQYVWYGGGYDVNMIVRDVPWKIKKGDYNCRWDLAREGFAHWKQYALSYVSRMQFTATYRCSKHRRGARMRTCKLCKPITVYDMLSLFGGSLEATCAKWQIDVPQIVRTGKRGRAAMAKLSSERIVAYCLAECAVMLALIQAYRATVDRAGLELSRPAARGLIASAWLRKHKFADTLCPLVGGNAGVVAQHVIMRAYHGGRTDTPGIGVFEGGSLLDMRSAFAWATARIPDMNALVGTWRHRKGPCEAAGLRPYALVHVRWSVPYATPWGPFPWRDPHGAILWPPTGEGWYYAVEVAAAQRRFRSKISVLETWDATGPHREPLRTPIEGLYAQRVAFAAQNDPAQYVIRDVLQTLWGKLAQKDDPDRPLRSFPAYQNFVLAGYIQAQVRARIAEALLCCYAADVKTIATDGLYCESRGMLPLGENLGDWREEPVDRIVILGTGQYTALGNDGTVTVQKQRGLDRNVFVEYERALSAFGVLPYEKRNARAHILRHREFVGMHMVSWNEELVPKLCTWRERKEPLPNPIHGTGKRGCDPRRVLLHPRDVPPGNLWLAPMQKNSLKYGEMSYPFNHHAYDSGDSLMFDHDETIMLQNATAMGECAE